MCKVSVIIPAYNAEGSIKETLDSILSQTFVDFECIVVDDGSTDKTVDVVKSISDDRIKIFSIPNSGGPSKPRNYGIKESSGEYIAIFDSDDLMDKNKLSAYMRCVSIYPDADVIFSDFSVIDEGGALVKKSFLADYSNFRNILNEIEPKIYFLNMKNFIKEIIDANFVGTSSVLFKKNLIAQEEIFDSSVKSGDDLLAWVRLSKKAQFYFINDSLHFYRVRSDSISNKNVERLLINKIAILDKIKLLCSSRDELIAYKNKRNEYLVSLAYFYRKSKNYSAAYLACFNMYGSRAFFKKCILLAKITIQRILKK